MKASVIIPSYKGAKRLPDILRCLEVQTCSEFEIVVVYDGSEDRSQDVLDAAKNRNMTCLNRINRGRAATRNTGAEVATGDILIFLDDDMLPEPDCVVKHLEFQQSHEYSILVGNTFDKVTEKSADFQRFRAWLTKRWLAFDSGCTLLSRPYITAQNFSIVADLFYELKGFDESLTDAEDFDLALRAVDKNIKIFFDPSVLAWHNNPVTCESYIRRQREYLLANKQVNQKYGLEVSGNTSVLKRIKFWPFSLSFWVRLIDRESFILFLLPMKIRYRLYDYVLTARSSVFT